MLYLLLLFFFFFCFFWRHSIEIIKGAFDTFLLQVLRCLGWQLLFVIFLNKKIKRHFFPFMNSWMHKLYNFFKCSKRKRNLKGSDAFCLWDGRIYMLQMYTENESNYMGGFALKGNKYSATFEIYNILSSKELVKIFYFNLLSKFKSIFHEIFYVIGSTN